MIPRSHLQSILQAGILSLPLDEEKLARLKNIPKWVCTKRHQLVTCDILQYLSLLTGILVENIKKSELISPTESYAECLTPDLRRKAATTASVFTGLYLPDFCISLSKYSLPSLFLLLSWGQRRFCFLQKIKTSL